ncbi:unnamed protein product [Blepharisma stoltei]|uniref:Uncharacterized protein n=1 Tax=Blepharisma stoltei TaxID=1481888 RepID=A0AAU9KKJ5_9CILI|nr:unnamed protein product [Blepharisma stoltei]
MQPTLLNFKICKNAIYHLCRKLIIMASESQEISDSMFSVDSERKLNQAGPIFVESEEVDNLRKLELSKKLIPEIIITTAKLFFSRNTNYEACKIKQQYIKDSLDLIAHTATQAEYKMQNDIELSFDPTSEIVEAIRPLKSRELVDEIEQYAQVAQETANKLHLAPSTSKAFTKINHIKFPTMLDESYMELSMVQSIDRSDHVIKIVNKSSYDWTSLILYEEQTNKRYKTMSQLLANSEISLTLTFQYESLARYKTLRFKILSFSRPVSNTCVVGVLSISNLNEYEDYYSFEIMNHLHDIFKPDLCFWVEDYPERVDTKTLPRLKPFSSQQYKRLQKVPGHQLCVELRLEGISSSRVYKLGETRFSS